MPVDVYCQVCNEPWDSYGVGHGDMEDWEREKFYGGQGCPACRFGTKQHKSNTNPRPGILAQRVEREVHSEHA